MRRRHEPRLGGTALLMALAWLLPGCSTCDDRDAQVLGPPPDPTKTPFNVVLVSVDTLRADRLGCYGYSERPSSPAIDALAADGVLFERFTTACPWTTPAHLSLLTSLYPSAHGLTSSFSDMWNGLFHRGEFFRLPSSRTTLAETLTAAGFRSVAFTAGGPLDPKIGFDQGFASYDTSMYKLQRENTQRMFDWLAANRGSQFFLFWHHFEVHAPYLNADFVGDHVRGDAAAEIAREVRRIKEMPIASIWPGGASRQRKQQVQILRAHDAFNRDVCESLYVGGVLEADRWMGKLVALLRDLGIYDRTLIVFTSDHGEEFGDHNPKIFYNTHGHILYDEMVRVPLIVKLPQSYAAGTRVGEVAGTVDVMPTILDVLGVDPGDAVLQGRSLAPAWAGSPADRPPGTAFTEATARKDEKKSLRTGRYKYILSVDAETVKEHGRGFLPPDRPLAPELYDLEADPRERRNLLQGRPSRAISALAARFDRELRAHVASQEGRAEATNLDESTVEQLKGLGYMGEDDDSRQTDAGPR